MYKLRLNAKFMVQIKSCLKKNYMNIIDQLKMLISKDKIICVEVDRLEEYLFCHLIALENLLKDSNIAQMKDITNHHLRI
jgi:hypothetical protein